MYENASEQKLLIISTKLCKETTVYFQCLKRWSKIILRFVIKFIDEWWTLKGKMI